MFKQIIGYSNKWKHVRQIYSFANILTDYIAMHVYWDIKYFTQLNICIHLLKSYRCKFTCLYICFPKQIICYTLHVQVVTVNDRAERQKEWLWPWDPSVRLSVPQSQDQSVRKRPKNYSVRVSGQEMEGQHAGFWITQVLLGESTFNEARKNKHRGIWEWVKTEYVSTVFNLVKISEICSIYLRIISVVMGDILTGSYFHFLHLRIH